MMDAVGSLTLLLIPLLHHVDEEGRSSEVLRQAVAELQAQVKEHQENSIAAGIPIDVVFVCDASMSMQQQIAAVNAAIWQCSELLPRVTRMRVGMIMYQHAQIYRYDLQELVLPAVDGGASRHRLKTFLDGVQLQGGFVDVVGAIELGIHMSMALPERTRQVLVLVGDVAPGDIAGVDAAATQHLKTQIQSWTSAHGADRRFLALFSGVSSATNPTYDVASHRAAFQRIADFEGGRFDDQATSVFPVLFETMFAPAKREK